METKKICMIAALLFGINCAQAKIPQQNTDQTIATPSFFPPEEGAEAADIPLEEGAEAEDIPLEEGMIDPPWDGAATAPYDLPDEAATDTGEVPKTMKHDKKKTEQKVDKDACKKEKCKTKPCEKQNAPASKGKAKPADKKAAG